MKRLIVCIVALVFSYVLMAQGKVTFLPSDSIKIEHLLSEAKEMSKEDNAILYFARKFIDIPYIAHTLETKDKEHLVINTRQLDCLTLVETASALAICHMRGLSSFTDYCDILRLLRYRSGVTDGYPSRIHYFSEWITDNKAKGLVDNIEFSSIPFTAVGKVNVWFMGKHPERYSMLNGRTNDINAIREIENNINGQYFRFIPKDGITNNAVMRHTVRDGDILAIVTSIPGLDIAHVGIAVWHSDGLHLLNASSLHHKVIEEPMTLSEYMSKHRSQLGFRVVRLNK